MTRNLSSPKVCVIGASLATENMGVNALAMGTFHCILHTFPQAEISLFDYNRKPVTYEVQVDSRNLEIPLHNIRFSKQPWRANHIFALIALAVLYKLLPFRFLRERLLAANPSIRHIVQSDIIAAISGGDSFSDIYGYGRLFYMSLPMILVILLDKDLILLPQTLGPFKGRIAKWVARYILTRSKVVFSRDQAAPAELQSLLGGEAKKRILSSCDVGFALEPRAPQNVAEIEKLTEKEPGVPLVGVNVSGLLFIGGYSQSNMFGLRIDYPEFVKKLISFLIEDCRALVLLVPHVYGETAGSESDLIASRTVFNELKGHYGDRLRLVNGRYSESEVKFIIGRCDFFTGARMHACIAAVSQCVPAVPIAYSSKFVGVMSTINIDQYVADARKMDADQILHLIQDALDKRAAIRESLGATIPRVKEKTLEVFAEFRNGSSPQN